MDAPHQIEFHREALPPLPVLERDWRMLEAAASRSSFFISWHWIGTMLEVVPTTVRPMLLRGLAHGKTVALALLGGDDSRRRHGLVRSRSLHLNETARFLSLAIQHNGILAAAGFETAAWEALIAWFAGARDEADELYVGGSKVRLPEDPIRRYGLRCSAIALPSYSVDLRLLEQSGGEPYPVLSANARQQLRRAFRHFEQFGPLRLREAESATEALEFFGAMKALHCASWERRGKPHSFTGPFFEPFHRRLIECSFAEGRVQLLRASAGGRIIGYLYNFRLGNCIYAYQSGFDDADRRERPGVVTHALAIRHAFRSGAQVLDFLVGRNRLKESFATRCEPMLWQVIQQRRFAFRMEDVARRLKRTIQSLLSAVRPTTS